MVSLDVVLLVLFNVSLHGAARVCLVFIMGFPVGLLLPYVHAACISWPVILCFHFGHCGVGVVLSVR